MRYKSALEIIKADYPEIKKELKYIKSKYKIFWKIINKIGGNNVHRDIMQHIIIRELIFENLKNKYKIIENVEKIKKEIIKYNDNPEKIFKRIISTKNKISKSKFKGKKINKKELKYGYLIISMTKYYKRMKHVCKVYDDEYERDIITKDMFKTFYENNINNRKLFIGNKRGFFWITKKNIYIKNLKVSKVKEFYHTLGLVDELDDDHLIIFKIKFKRNKELYIPTMFEGGILNNDSVTIWRPQKRKDKWGETVNTFTLGNGYPEAITKTHILNKKDDYQIVPEKRITIKRKFVGEKIYKKYLKNSLEDLNFKLI